MVERLRDESGLGLVELIIAMFMLTVALLALSAGYDSAAVSVHNADKKTVAAKLASSQLELYQSLKPSLIGLDQATLTSIQAAGSAVPGAADYVSDGGNLSPRGTDHTIGSCGSTPQCLPIQDVTGPENHPYRIETFIRDVVNTGATGTWNERYVTVTVRDRGAAGNPVLFSETTAFDPGPS
jgi:type II secretory pathway pseudopilin PulG